MTSVDWLMGMPVSMAVGWTLLHSLWQGAIAALALAVVLSVSRSSRIRYAAASVALLTIVVCWAVTFQRLLPAEGESARTLIDVARPAKANLPAAIKTGGHDQGLITLIPLLAPIWLAGVCLFYCRYTAAWFSLNRLRRRMVCRPPDLWRWTVERLALEIRVKQPVDLLESLWADTPMVIGHFRPAVLVPLGFLCGLPMDCIELILLHELAHIRRSDYLVNACQRLIEGLLFYHPAVWWISRVMRTERENCCDDMVVSLRSDPHRYARALATLEQSRLEKQWPGCAAAMAANGGNLMKRVKRLLQPKRPSGIWAPIFAAVFLIAGAGIIAAAWKVDHHSVWAAAEVSKPSHGAWQNWLNEDVVYIISKEERIAFESLKTDEEREEFVKQFWAQRDPTPGTEENEYKEEHYRRMAHANDHWGYAHTPGWKSSRGRIYILNGPPDEVDAHPSGGRHQLPASAGGRVVDTYPFEDWRYKKSEGGSGMTFEFVDPTMTGEYRLASDPNGKYKLH